MGLATAGLAFKPTSSTPSEQDMIRRAFGEECRFIPESDLKASHDIRLPGNIDVESTHGATFVYCGDIAERILFKEEVLDASFLAAIGDPEVVVVFCHYESGGSFGYAIFEKGVRARFRLHSQGTTSDKGAPMEFELPWLNAQLVVEEEGEPPAYLNTRTGRASSETYLTAVMLDDTMMALFGVCPWEEWNYKTKLNHYCKESSA